MGQSYRKIESSIPLFARESLYPRLNSSFTSTEVLPVLRILIKVQLLENIRDEFHKEGFTIKLGLIEVK